MGHHEITAWSCLRMPTFSLIVERVDQRQHREAVLSGAVKSSTSSFLLRL
jgi:hypothetical protein